MGDVPVSCTKKINNTCVFSTFSGTPMYVLGPGKNDCFLELFRNLLG